MSIKITEQILSIPPYLSTNWSRVGALHMKGDTLAITLTNSETIYIPHLDKEIVQLIFHYHALYLEKEQTSSHSDSSKLKNSLGEESSIRLAFGSSSEGLEGLGNMMQHNPSQSDAPDLPPEVLQKIGAIAKIIGSTDEVIIPKAEPGCNCFHCQIARALNANITSPTVTTAEEVEVADEELQFQQWTIVQTGDKLFSVINRLDEHEKYHVYLGQPIGCTCGKEGCEHILAVLKS